MPWQCRTRQGRALAMQEPADRCFVRLVTSAVLVCLAKLSRLTCLWCRRPRVSGQASWADKEQLIGGGQGMSRLLVFLLCSLVSLPAIAAEQEAAREAAQENGQQRPLIQVDISFEMDAINEALQKTSVSVDEISKSFKVLAEGGQLDGGQQQQLANIMDNLDHVVGATRTSMDALPALVDRSRQTLATQLNEFFDSLKFWTITILVLLCVALIIAAACLYYFALRPLQNLLFEVTGNIRDMAKTLENSAKSLEISNQVQLEFLKLSKASDEVMGSE